MPPSLRGKQEGNVRPLVVPQIKGSGSLASQLTSRAKVFPPMLGQELMINNGSIVSPYIPAGMNYPVIILFSIAASEVLNERAAAHIILTL